MSIFIIIVMFGISLICIIISVFANITIKMNTILCQIALIFILISIPSGMIAQKIWNNAELDLIKNKTNHVRILTISTKTCKYCGTHYIKNAKYCQNCGKKIN